MFEFRFCGLTVKIGFCFFFSACMAFALLGKNAYYFFAACAIHEAGHLIPMLAFGAKIKTLNLCGAGIEFCADTKALSLCKELFVLFGGSFANALCAALFLFGGQRNFFAVSCAFLAIYSLLPAEGLDGGTAFEIIFGKKLCSLLQIALSALLIAAMAAFLEKPVTFALVCAYLCTVRCLEGI